MRSGAPVWRVIVVTQDSARTVEFTAGGSFSLPEGANATIAATATGDLLELRAGKPGAVLLNDVQVVGTSELRSGDQLRANGTTVLIQRATPRTERLVRAQWTAEQFEARARSELRRIDGHGGQVHLGIARGAEAIDWPDGVELCERGAGVTFVLAFDADLAEAARSSANATGAQLAFAQAPKDGRALDALWTSALSALGASESPERPVDEPVAVDPAMVRLRALVERISSADGAVVFVGEPGSGRARWALHLHARSGHRADSVVRVDCATASTPAGAAFEDGGTVLLEGFDALDEAAQHAWMQALRGRAQVLATASAPLSDRIREAHFRAELAVPPLRDRPSEVLAYAMQAVQRARGWLGRRGLALNADGRAALQAYDWPGNVRELRNAVLLGALVSESDELRAENLPPAIVRAWRQSKERRGAQDLRASMKAAEKDELLKVLARTQWNVTQAARELGLPRRTVVYRMSRLGLRRPHR